MEVRKKKLNKKGFTLIELLAVIVILGLLMAIAIPSVTRYITQSRKKTLVSTIGNYITALSNEVNDSTYTFTGTNTIYAVPIECIALERGGTDPFGAWHQASSSYWAYVLVQYDDINSKYIYGFTFKDSAGYGIYPTTQAKLNEKGSQINTDLDLRKLVSGSYINGADEENWNGFYIDEETKIRVLKSELEGNIGDGINTCTLKQKGANYDSVQEEYKDRTLELYNGTKYFWEYKDKIKNVTFQNYINIPDSAVKYWDVSKKQNGMVMAYIGENSSDSNYYDLYIQANGEIYANPNSSYLFSGFVNVDSINNIEVLDTSKVTNMMRMFEKTGYNSTVFTLDLGDNFDTSKVTSMLSMFASTGYNSTVFTLDLGDNFNTSKVTSMFSMFASTGYNSTVFTLDLGDKFDTSNVVTMSGMFRTTGYNSTVFTLDLGDKFDTSNVTDMWQMFVSNGINSQVFTLDLGDKFDTSNVTEMGSMFASTGSKSTDFTLDLGDKFDTSNVTNMAGMFGSTGSNSTVFTLDLGDKFDTSNVTNMAGMFGSTGFKSTVFKLDLGDKFDTSNVTDMKNMFSGTGRNSTVFKLDCSNWNVDKVTSYSNFNLNVTSKVTAPTWVN